MLKSFIKKRNGFTLIELLVVIAVIGLLASIVLVSMGPAREKNRDARRKSDIKQISIAMEMCFDDSSSDCGGFEKYIEVTEAGANKVTKIGSYLIEVPKDPSDIGDHIYKWSNNSAVEDQKYCVYVKLEDEDYWIVASEKGTNMEIGAEPPTTLTSINSCW